MPRRPFAKRGDAHGQPPSLSRNSALGESVRRRCSRPGGAGGDHAPKRARSRSPHIVRCCWWPSPALQLHGSARPAGGLSRMIMAPRLRKLALAVHIALSVGWIGAVAGYIALDVTAATGQDARTLRGVYLAMGLIAWYVIVPLGLASLLTGLVMSLGTKWGLFRYYWTLISLLLTAVATVVLLVETQTIGYFAAMAAEPATSGDDLRSLGSTLVHSVGGMVVLLAILVLNVYKPRGMTRYGWRKQGEKRRKQYTMEPDLGYTEES